MSEADIADIELAPICSSCGVKALPAETSNLIDSGFAGYAATAVDYVRGQFRLSWP